MLAYGTASGPSLQSGDRNGDSSTGAPSPKPTRLATAPGRLPPDGRQACPWTSHQDVPLNVPPERGPPPLGAPPHLDLSPYRSALRRRLRAGPREKSAARLAGRLGTAPA